MHVEEFVLADITLLPNAPPCQRESFGLLTHDVCVADVSSASGGKLLVSLGSLLDDQHWHFVKLERISTHLSLTVDKNTQQVHLPAELSHWHVHTVRKLPVVSLQVNHPMHVLKDLNFLSSFVVFCLVQLSAGAAQNHGLQKPILPNRNFHGCMENLLYNDLSLIKLVKQSSPHVTAVVSYCFC